MFDARIADESFWSFFLLMSENFFNTLKKRINFHFLFFKLMQHLTYLTHELQKKTIVKKHYANVLLTVISIYLHEIPFVSRRISRRYSKSIHVRLSMFMSTVVTTDWMFCFNSMIMSTFVYYTASFNLKSKSPVVRCYEAKKVVLCYYPCQSNDAEMNYSTDKENVSYSLAIIFAIISFL